MAYAVRSVIWPKIVVYEGDQVLVNFPVCEGHIITKDVFTVIHCGSTYVTVVSDDLGYYTVGYGDLELPEAE